MDDPLFAILDDIAHTAKGGASGHHDGTSNRFGDHQLLDDKPKYYVSQQPAQSLRRDEDFPDQRRDESRYADEDKYLQQPQGEQALFTTFPLLRSDTDLVEESQCFQNQGAHVAPGLSRLAVASNTSRQANTSMRPPQQHQQRVKDEYMSNGKCLCCGPDIVIVTNLTRSRPATAFPIQSL